MISIQLQNSKYLTQLTKALNQVDYSSYSVSFITKNIFKHDATSRSVIEQSNILEALGFKVKFYAEKTSTDLENLVKSKELIGSIPPKDLIIFHYSIEDKYLDQLLKLPNKKILYYHGITPPEFLTSGSSLHLECVNGLKALPKLNSFDAIIANSQFCLNQVKAAINSTKRYDTLPPSISFNKWDLIQEDITFRQKKIHPKFLYIGRKFPHKNIHGLLDFFNKFVQKFGLGQLIIAGAGYEPEYYLPLKEKYSKNEDILFYETISEEQLKSLYLNTDYVVTFSQHEGFCVPILEAAKFGKTVITHSCSALSETSLISKSIVVPLNDYQLAIKETIKDWKSEDKGIPSSDISDEFFINKFINIIKDFL